MPLANLHALSAGFIADPRALFISGFFRHSEAGIWNSFKIGHIPLCPPLCDSVKLLVDIGLLGPRVVVKLVAMAHRVNALRIEPLNVCRH